MVLNSSFDPTWKKMIEPNQTLMNSSEKFSTLENKTQCQETVLSRLPPSLVPTFLAILIIISVLVISLNFIVLLVYTKTKTLHRQPTKLLMSLAVADLLVGALIGPASIAQLIVPKNCSFGIMVYSTTPLLVVTGLTVISISYDRYLYVTKGWKYRDIMTRCHFKCIILVPWCLAMTTLTSKFFSRTMMVWFYVILFVFSYLILAVCYTALYKRLKQRQLTWKSYPEGSHTHVVIKQTHKAMLLIRALMLCNIACTFPAAIYSVLILLQHYNVTNMRAFLHKSPFQAITLICILVNSILDPIFYFAASEEFLAAFKKLLRNCKCCRPQKTIHDNKYVLSTLHSASNHHSRSSCLIPPVSALYHASASRVNSSTGSNVPIIELLTSKVWSPVSAERRDIICEGKTPWKISKRGDLDKHDYLQRVFEINM